jgi:uncharacterized protein (UPF0335 family)
MPRRRSKPEPEAQVFAQRDFLTCVQALDTAQEEVVGSKEVMDAAKEAAAAMGFDVKAMDEIRKLYNKVQDLFRAGEMSVTVTDETGSTLN